MGNRCNYGYIPYTIRWSVDAEYSSFWKMLHAFQLELEENIGGKYYLLVCGYSVECDGGPYYEDGRDDSFEVGCGANLL